MLRRACTRWPTWRRMRPISSSTWQDRLLCSSDLKLCPDNLCTIPSSRHQATQRIEMHSSAILWLLFAFTAFNAIAATELRDFLGGAGYMMRVSGGQEIYQNEEQSLQILNSANHVIALASVAYWDKATCDPSPFLGITEFTVEGWFRYNSANQGKTYTFSVGFHIVLSYCREHCISRCIAVIF